MRYSVLSPRVARLAGLTSLFLILIRLYRSIPLHPAPSNAIARSLGLTGLLSSRREVTLVACHSPTSTRSNESIDWLHDSFPDWNVAIYNMDDPASVPANKGDEAMAYLTYIIDHYDNFPSPITIFHHASRFQWHSDDPVWDGKRLLRRLRLDYVKEQGYTSIRCSWKPGCLITYTQVPNDAAEVPTDHRLNTNFVAAFKSTFPGEKVPDSVGHPCCAEFAVTSEVIRQRPRVTYERARNWLIETELDEGHLGRAFEYMWHSKPTIYIPLDTNIC